MSDTRCTLIRVRKNINNLSAKELTKFRGAMAAIQALPRSDNRSFEWVAAQHGCDQQHCPHHRPGFLTWHRAYINALEMNLRAVDPDVTHPYWDWSAADADGLPKAYTDKTYVNAAGKRKPNPLRAYTFECPAGSPKATTSRNPGAKPRLAQLGEQARRSLALNSFQAFQDTSVDAIQNSHDGLHGWVGGSMASISFAAYDPIFYAHHANVDRIWAAWQAKFGNSTMPQLEMQLKLTPWPVQGRDVLDTKRQLCYRYAYGVAFVKKPRVTAAALEALADEGPKPLTIRFSPAKVGKAFDSAELQLRNLHFPEESYEVRVFVNDPQANLETSVSGNDHYAGSLNIFGHGECYGAPGHCDPVPREPGDLREEHHLTPVDRSIDLTPALRLAGPEKGGVSVTLVVCDTDGKLVDHSVLSYDDIALISRD